MTLIQAIILGIVEGITEFLPVSSTGHLLLAQRLMGLPSDAVSNAFAIVIQGGAIIAVMGLYRARLLDMITGIFRQRSAGFRLLTHLVVAFFPAALIGYFLDETIEQYLFGLWAVCMAWFFWGILIVIFSRKFLQRAQNQTAHTLETMQTKHAVLIGLAQTLALWPGTSRSLVTILAALLLGFRMRCALEFSFLLGLATLGAATLYKAKEHGAALFGSDTLGPTIAGLISACVFAALSIKWMLNYLEKNSFAFFGYWRIAVALVTVFLIWNQHILP